MILAVVQARMSSTRLPGKVLKPILGEPMIVRQLERIGRSRGIGRVVIATSDDPSDDVLQQEIEGRGFTVFRGKLNDVLDRFYQAVCRYPAEQVVRLTADCPLIDPDVIDQLIAFHLQGCFDYSSNAVDRTFPDGLDAEIFTFAALERAWRNADQPYHREHVTPYIYQHPEIFRLGHLIQDENLSQMRWTVDTVEDYEFVKKIYEALYPANFNFSTADILNFQRGGNTGYGQ